MQLSSPMVLMQGLAPLISCIHETLDHTLMMNQHVSLVVIGLLEVI